MARLRLQRAQHRTLGVLDRPLARSARGHRLTQASAKFGRSPWRWRRPVRPAPARRRRSRPDRRHNAPRPAWARRGRRRAPPPMQPACRRAWRHPRNPAAAKARRPCLGRRHPDHRFRRGLGRPIPCSRSAAVAWVDAVSTDPTAPIVAAAAGRVAERTRVGDDGRGTAAHVSSPGGLSCGCSVRSAWRIGKPSRAAVSVAWWNSRRPSVRGRLCRRCHLGATRRRPNAYIPAALIPDRPAGVEPLVCDFVWRAAASCSSRARDGRKGEAAFGGAKVAPRGRAPGQWDRADNGAHRLISINGSAPGQGHIDARDPLREGRP